MGFRAGTQTRALDGQTRCVNAVALTHAPLLASIVIYGERNRAHDRRLPAPSLQHRHARWAPYVENQAGGFAACAAMVVKSARLSPIRRPLRHAPPGFLLPVRPGFLQPSVNAVTKFLVRASEAQQGL